MFDKIDVIVVGGGHSGCEATISMANLGSHVLFITMNMQTFGQMSCNPAMGGIAKGQIVKEIDALGGYSGIISDQSMIQFRMLNKSKGPAMWSPRTQNDRVLFSTKWRGTLEKNNNISFLQDVVDNLIIENNKVVGVETKLGNTIKAKAVILTSGTFLNGKIHVGMSHLSGGRMGEKASSGITEILRDYGFESGRLKTGTPPRIDGRSIDYSKTEVQKGDDSISSFSYMPNTIPIKPEQQKNCWITYTNSEVHDILRTGFEDSPIFTGRIDGKGPRYCPSIEDKITRFAERDRHQLFIEPEGWNTVEIYLNGFSTSLPQDTQIKALKKIPCLKNCKIFRPGYAIEYDYFPPTQLKHTLETKNIENLFFAGQINGTTGYEEAACQGLYAGINAHQKINNLEPFVLKRNEAYIGVLIDDLINKGIDEPYRMFTSRSEFRTLLRQDNADLRLTEKSFNIGLCSKERMKIMERKKRETEALLQSFRSTNIEEDELNSFLLNIHSRPVKQKQRIDVMLLRPEISIKNLYENCPTVKTLCKKKMKDSLEQVEIQIKYKSYIEKEKAMYERQQNLENLKIPKNFNYDLLKSLSSEAKEKLIKIKPINIGQASRISGVNPTDIQLLLVHMGR